MNKPSAILEAIDGVGCVLDTSLFEDFEGGIADQRGPILEHFGKHDPADPAVLARLEPSRLSRNAFLGDWYDAERRSLVVNGSLAGADGVEHHRATLEALDRIGSKSGAWSVPEPGTRGNFAYAFYSTPYSLQGSGVEIQALFEKLLALLAPGHAAVDYYDWSDSDLLALSPRYYAAGNEWWGMFLFTIHNRTDRRLWVISASTTD